MLLNCYHCHCERVKERTLHKRDRGAEVGGDQRQEGAQRRAKRKLRDFPGGLVVKTLRSQCRGPRFNPWWGN